MRGPPFRSQTRVWPRSPRISVIMTANLRLEEHPRHRRNVVRTLTGTAAACLLTVPLLLSACGGGAGAGEATPSATPSTVVLDAEQADRIGASPGTALVLETPSTTTSVTDQPSPTASQDAVNKLQNSVSAQTGIQADATADYDSYDTKSAEGLTLEVPTAWTWRTSCSDCSSRANLIITAPTSDGYFAQTDPSISVAARAAKDDDDPTKLMTSRSGYYLQNCTAGDQRPYEDDRYIGVTQTFTNCKGTQTKTVIIVVKSKAAASPYVLDLEAAILDAKDVSAFGRAMRTFTFTADHR